MKVKDALSFFKIKSADTRNVYSLSNDTRTCKRNSILVLLDHGVDYLANLKTKPLIILSNREVEGTIYIPNLKEQIGPFCNYFYHIQKDRPHLIGIVGTNGKTSVATILHYLLKKSSVVTTIKNVRHSYLSANTTPNAIELANDIVKARKHHYHFLILEVSSIGIKEKRVEGFKFDYLIFTNLSKDHLDYHKTLEDYQNTKLDFLKNSKGILLVNQNDKFGQKLLQERYLTYGYKYEDSLTIDKNLEGTTFAYDDQVLKTRLIGHFNMENLYAVLTMLKILGKKVDYKRLKEMPPVKGRMDVVNRKPNVIIDYAHTEEAMHQSLKETKDLCKNRLIVVFGAGGERDRSKRHIYGKMASQYADQIILTNDNPRGEDPRQIIADIKGHNRAKFEVILSRSEAIKAALKRLHDDDTLLILGKGHEDYQLINDTRIPYSDYDEVKKWQQM